MLIPYGPKWPIHKEQQLNLLFADLNQQVSDITLTATNFYHKQNKIIVGETEAHYYHISTN